MTGLFFLPALRRLGAWPLRLIVVWVVGTALTAIPDLLLRRYLDADLPRPAVAALIAILAAAALFLRASWRRRANAAAASPRPAFRLWIGLRRDPDGLFTRTVMVFDRHRRQRPLAGGEPHVAGTGPGRISRR